MHWVKSTQLNKAKKALSALAPAYLPPPLLWFPTPLHFTCSNTELLAVLLTDHNISRLLAFVYAMPSLCNVPLLPCLLGNLLFLPSAQMLHFWMGFFEITNGNCSLCTFMPSGAPGVASTQPQSNLFTCPSLLLEAKNYFIISKFSVLLPNRCSIIVSRKNK